MHRDRFGFTPEDHYEVLDATLTELLHSLDADIGEEQLKLLLVYNRRLRNALGLPVDAAN